MLFTTYKTLNYPIYYAFQFSTYLNKTNNNIKTSNNKLADKNEETTLSNNQLTIRLKKKQSNGLHSISQALISPLIVLLLLPLMVVSTPSGSPLFGIPGSPFILFSGRHHFQYPWGEQKEQRHNMRTFSKRSEPLLPFDECLQSTLVQRAATSLLADLPATSITEERKKQRRLESVEYVTETGIECPNEENIKGLMNDDNDREIAPGMPLEISALCPFVYVENVNERRLPRRITEVRCLCEKPSRRQRSSTHDSEGVHCEPLHFSIPVLLFDDDCSEPKRSLERVTLGCVAAHGARSRSGFLSAIGQPRPLIITEQQF